MSIDSSLSNSIIFTIACRKSLVEGAQGYMLLFHAKVEVENNVLAIPVVYEFLDVFAREVFSLPPNMDVEFSIDLVLGNGNVSIAPYRM